MVTITLLSAGYDMAGEYWTTNAFQAMSVRFKAWQENNKGNRFGVRYQAPNGPYIGHLESLYYDPIVEELRAEIDLSSDTTGEASEIVSRGRANPFYRVTDRDEAGQVTDAYIGAIVVFTVAEGVRFTPGGPQR